MKPKDTFKKVTPDEMKVLVLLRSNEVARRNIVGYASYILENPELKKESHVIYIWKKSAFYYIAFRSQKVLVKSGNKFVEVWKKIYSLNKSNHV